MVRGDWPKAISFAFIGPFGWAQPRLEVLSILAGTTVVIVTYVAVFGVVAHGHLLGVRAIELWSMERRTAL